MRLKQSQILDSLVGIGTAIFTTLLFLWPLIVRIGDHLTSHDDGLLIAWTVDWVSRAILEAQSVFNAPLLFPYTNTLAFSQLFLSTGLINIPFHLMNLSIMTQANLHFILGSFFMWLSMFGLMYYVTKSREAAVLSALIFVWSPFHLEFIVHLHAYLLAGIPLSVYGLLKFGDTVENAVSKKMRLQSVLFSNAYLWLSAAAFLYQALNDPHTAFFTIGVIACILMTHRKTRQALWKHKLLLIAPALVTVGLITLTYLPYIVVSRTFEYTRSIRDAAHFSYSLDRFIKIDMLIMATIMVFLIYFVKKTNKKNKKTYMPLKHASFLITILGFALMLGPVLKLSDQTVKLFGLPLPLPYAVAYYLIPGFQALRAATRWLLVANTGLALLSGLFLAQSNMHATQKYLLLLGITGCFLFIHSKTLPLFAIETSIPAIYTTVASHAGETLIELPAFHWDMPPFSSQEARRLLYQTYHRKKRFNGITGFTPPERLNQLVQLWHEFPNPAMLKYLRDQGVTLLLVDFAMYDQMAQQSFSYDGKLSPWGHEIETKIHQIDEMTLISCQENACLYQL